MRHDRRLPSPHAALTTIYWLTILSAAVLSASAQITVAALPEVIQSSAAWLQSKRTLAPYVIAVVVILDGIRRRVPQPWLWETVQKLLTSFQRDLFKKELARGEPIDHHRLTLFKRVPRRWALCRWPTTGWMIPIERSGHVTRSSGTAFRAPDRARNAEGVAGNTWRADVIIFRDNLPDVSAPDAADADVARYARETWATPEALRRRPPFARSYVGIPVVVKGKPWGVVVVDSSEPECKRTDADLRSYGLIQAVLGKILERE